MTTLGNFIQHIEKESVTELQALSNLSIQDSTKKTSLQCIPTDILLLILGYLGKKNVQAVFNTCKQFASMSPKYAAHNSFVGQIVQHYRSFFPALEEELLSKIEKNATLVKELHFSTADITDNDLKTLTDLFSRVDTVTLFDCQKITKKGLLSLARFTKLQSLRLRLHTNITDEDFMFLENLTSLVSLHLFECPNITAARLKPLTNLKELYIINCCNITNIDFDHVRINFLQHVKKVTYLFSSVSLVREREDDLWSF